MARLRWIISVLVVIVAAALIVPTALWLKSALAGALRVPDHGVAGFGAFIVSFMVTAVAFIGVAVVIAVGYMAFLAYREVLGEVERPTGDNPTKAVRAAPAMLLWSNNIPSDLMDTEPETREVKDSIRRDLEHLGVLHTAGAAQEEPPPATEELVGDR